MFHVRMVYLPVVTAVHGFCLGGGIGMSGASDIVFASEDATFGLPEIDRGALGAATHLYRMFGMAKMPPASSQAMRTDEKLGLRLILNPP